jgi:integrase
MQIRVEQGKGKKDRYTLLATTLLEELRTYWKLYRPQEWLFAGRIPGKALTESSVQRAFIQAKKKQGSPSLLPSIPYAIALLPTFWSRAPIYLSFNNCSAIQA